MKKWILRFTIHRTGVYLVSVMLAIVLCYVLGAGVYFYYLHVKVETYANSILSRSESLIKQIQLIEDARDEFSVYTPCSDQYLHELRKRLWSYPLVKDIAYVSNQQVVCSALWGKLRTPLSLNLYRNKANFGSYTWVFDANIEENITGDVLYTTNFAIILSPFSFQRFWKEAEEMNFSAIIGDYRNENIFFKVGNNTNLLEAIEYHERRLFNYMTIRACSRLEDICVIAGTVYPILFNYNPYIIFFIISISIILGFLNAGLYISSINKNHSLLSRLESAILKKEFNFVYQPIYCVETRRVTGAEALIRWDEYQMGTIGPDIFIPLAERNGLINKINHYVVECTLSEFAPILHRYNIILSINVNCSDICDNIFRAKLLTTLEREKIPGNMIMLEITERQNANIEDLKKAILDYKDSGIRFALDDFGTGYSNLNWLSLLDVDEIKIDKSLIDYIGTASSFNPILSGLIGMLNKIDKLVVFEGIENETQCHFIFDNVPDCCAQGWYFSKPLKFDDIHSLIASQQDSDLDCPQRQ
ncbi:EAL domain-containing protein [Klebsiella michiganensis]|uniref:EAL domain-containing protein n=1 Tax=Klebsiella michiganensis TaxID=1134687 RepID=UPI0027FF73B3|nr:EAL domain-containing protein [Klebsiella michiganensis]MDQ7856395.1 EAL domain-containing protein [Klebsiella michiganensis]